MLGGEPSIVPSPRLPAAAPSFLSLSATFPESSVSPATVSVVIPLWNERQALPGLLACLKAIEGLHEVLWVDGGSADGTAEWLRAHGCSVLEAPRGRGSQLHAGAEAATGQVLWFLHADSEAPPGAALAIQAAVAAGHGVGAFRLCFRDGGWPGCWMTWLYAHLRRCGLLYGDAGIFVRRELYQAAGGFPAWPLFEDQGLLQRLRRGHHAKPVCLQTAIHTSSRRFRGWRFPLVFSQWVLLQVLFWCGVPPHMLARMYGARRTGAMARTAQPVAPRA